MAKQRTTFDKLQRERAKKAKAAAKRERRQSRGGEDESAVTESTTDRDHDLTAPELLERIENLHRRFEAKMISFEDFEAEKAELFEKLSVLPMD
jgi:hypothetical protein